MSERVNWIDYKGKKIIYADYSKLIKAEDIIKVIKDCKTEITSKKDVLLLVNIEGSSGSPAVMTEYKNFAKETKDNVKKTAITGVAGLHKILLNSVKTFSGVEFEIKDNLDIAKEYLIS